MKSDLMTGTSLGSKILIIKTALMALPMDAVAIGFVMGLVFTLAPKGVFSATFSTGVAVIIFSSVIFFLHDD